jgi:NO-binding membrane sensor protein with MHYT domain
MPSPRSLVCHYNPSMVAAALTVSLLGAFTSTQLMSQARGARTLPGVFIWSILGSLAFGFCATWCLHFLAMLSCEFDVPIGLNPLLTVLSAVVAVFFTFGALSTDLIQKHWRQKHRKKFDIERHSSTFLDRHLDSGLESRQSSEPLLRPSVELPEAQIRKDVVRATADELPQSTEVDHIQDGTSNTDALLPDIGVAYLASQRAERSNMDEDGSHQMMLPFSNANQSDPDNAHFDDILSVAGSQSRLSFDGSSQRAGSTRISSLRINSVFDPNPSPATNTLVFAAQTILNGLTLVTVIKGFVWSMAITNMHFIGVKALVIPGGFVVLSPARVILCALVSWSVCCVGVILMAGIEVNIKQQIFFSIVAASGVGAVHFSGT